MLERISPRQVYVVGSAASALGLGYVSLAIGKVITTTLISNERTLAITEGSVSCTTPRKIPSMISRSITPWLCGVLYAKTASVGSRSVHPINDCHDYKGVPSTIAHPHLKGSHDQFNTPYASELKVLCRLQVLLKSCHHGRLYTHRVLRAQLDRSLEPMGVTGPLLSATGTGWSGRCVRTRRGVRVREIPTLFCGPT